MISSGKVDEIMYRGRYIKKCQKDYEFVWDCVKRNNPMLEESIVVKRDKFDESDTFLI